jgi:hypothetical protein
MNGSVFGQDGNAPLPLDVARVHDAVLNLLVAVKYPALLKHLVYQGGFAMVYMGDDGNVSDVVSNHIVPFRLSL